MSCTPECLDLPKRVQAAFAEIRSCRLTRSENGKRVHLDQRVVNLAKSNQPTDGARYLGHDLDEQLVTLWREAVTRLLNDADAPLPPP